MKKACYLFSTITLLTGCSDPNAANDQNVNSAITHYLDDAGGAICLNLHQWPLDLAPDDLRMLQRFPHGIAAQMVVLENTGIVKSQDVKLDGLDFNGHPNIGKRYQLTDKGKIFYHAKETDQFGQSYDADLCVAHKQLEKIVEWKLNPDNVNPSIYVTYSYTVNNVADWAKTAAFKTGFSDINVSTTPQSEQRTLSLMDKGWWVKADTNAVNLK